MSGPLGSQQWMYATGEQPFYPYTIANSCRFDGSSYLRRLSATSSAIHQFTMSFWVKISDGGSSTSTPYHLMSFQATGSTATAGLCLYDNEITYFFNNSAYASFNPAKARDYSSWYHVVWKNKSDYYADIYVNGVLVGTTVPSFEIINGSAISVGAGTSGNNPFAGGYIADVHFVSGQSLGPDSFGEYDSTGTIWKPKAFSGSHGTDGFHLDFADNTSATTLGYDVSGNSNNFTPSGIATSDQMLDSPTNNFATLNPLDPGTTGTLSEGNLVTSGNAKVTMRPAVGQWYYEKDGVGVSYDADASGEFNPTLTAGTYNFGQRPWADVGPTGNQKAICTQNLPAPTFDPAQGESPQDAFNVYTDTGANILATAQSDYSDGLFWIKDYQNAADHQLLNTVTNTVLESNTTDAERAYSAPSGSSVAWSWKGGGSGSAFNIDGVGYATASAAGLGVGTLNPTGATVNTKAGIGIYTYTGSGDESDTVAHGLAAAPECMIVKNGDTPRNWTVYHVASSSTPENDFLLLNATNSVQQASSLWNNIDPTSTVFTIGTSDNVNASGDGYIAYCFHSAEGFSKFGSYEGNASADGTFVYTGFKPAWVMIKNADATGNWNIFDTKRDGYNVDNNRLLANASDAEYTDDVIDLLSNGFKMRNSSVQNGAYTYIYMAFAEQPFKYSTAR